MRVLTLAVVAGLAVGSTYVEAQRGRATAPARPAAPAATARRMEPAKLNCPQVLGEGVQTMRTFCDVQIGGDPAAGITIAFPPHTGDVTLTFDLHNRHTYSEELAKTNRGFRRYTATIGVLALDNTLLERAIVHSEFRTAADLVDRITGGTGPGGLKAVAPTGSETIVMTIAAEEGGVSILGEKLTEARLDAPPDTFTAAGRPIAVISNVTIDYRPGPVRRPATRRR